MKTYERLLTAENLALIFSAIIFMGSVFVGARVAMSAPHGAPPVVDSDFVDACAGAGSKVVRRWPKLPVTMRIDDSVPQDAQQGILAAAKRWNRTFKGVQIFDIRPSLDELPPEVDGLSRIHWVKEGWEYKDTHLALARWDAGEDQIMEEADIYINFEYYDYALGDEPVKDMYDLQSLLLHELGHVLGLCHVDETVMNATLDDNFIMREITTDIREQVACLYQDQSKKLAKACRVLKSQILAEKIKAKNTEGSAASDQK